MSESHQLVAIMFTDVVGYTALMEANEQTAYGLLKKNREIHKHYIDLFRGKWLKEAGDGTLAMFSSVIDAVHCAASILNSVEEVPDLNIRIGLHLGEVILDNDDIFGDGVNIASRLQSLSPVGGILVSEALHDNIRNQTGVQTTFIAEQQLKNVSRSIKIFQLHVDKAVLKDHTEKEVSNTQESPRTILSRRSIWTYGVITLLLVLAYLFFNKTSSEANLPLPDRNIERSIAILPFKNLSPEEDNQYFSDGMMDAILNNLSKLSDLQVVSRTSTEKYRETNLAIPTIGQELDVSYILEGSVQRYGDNVRILVQLVDASVDKQLWSESYDRELTEVFELQSDVAEQIAMELNSEFSPYQRENFGSPPYGKSRSIRFVSQGRQFYKDFNLSGDTKALYSAIQSYKKALALDPEFFLAKVQIGWTYLDRVNVLGEGFHLYDSALSLATGLVEAHANRSELLSLLGTTYRFKGVFKDRAKELLIQAVAINPNDPMALTGLSWYYSFEENRQDLALYLRKKSSGIEPDNVFYVLDEAWSWMLMDYFETSEAKFLQAIEMQPNFSAAYNSLCTLYIIWNEDYDKGISHCEQALEYDSVGVFNTHHLAQYYSWVGRFKESNEYFEKIVAVVESDSFNITRNTPWFPHRYAYTLWNLGLEDEALDYFQQETERDLRFLAEDIQTWDYNAYYDLAATYAFLDNKKEAYYWLNKLLENHSWGPPSFIQRDPLFNKLKGEERFEMYISAYAARIQRQRENYEVIKNMAISEFIETLKQPLQDLPTEPI